jgi:hypothetical protein
MSAFAAGEPGNQSPRADGTATHDPQTTSQMVPGMDGGSEGMQSRGMETDLGDRYRDDYYPERGYRGGGGYRDERYRGWDDRDYDRQRGYDYDRHRGGQGRGDSGGFSDEASRFARQHLRTGETKEFFKTSEFFLTLIGAITLIVAAAVQDTFDAPEMWRLFTFLFVAYIISRGIAKAGSSKSDNRRGQNNN